MNQTEPRAVGLFLHGKLHQARDSARRRAKPDGLATGGVIGAVTPVTPADITAMISGNAAPLAAPAVAAVPDGTQSTYQAPSSGQADSLGYNPTQYQPGVNLPPPATSDTGEGATAAATALNVLKNIGPTVKGATNGGSDGLTNGLSDLGSGVKTTLFGVGDGTTVAPTVGDVAPEFAISPEAADISNAAGQGVLGSTSDVLGSGASLSQIGTGLGGVGGLVGGAMGLANAGNQNAVGIAGDAAQLIGGGAALGSALGLIGATGWGLPVAAIGAIASSLFGNKHPQHPTGQATATVDATGSRSGGFDDFTTDHGNAAPAESFVDTTLLPKLQDWAKTNGYNLDGNKFGFINNAGTPGITFQQAGPDHGTILNWYDANDPNSFNTALQQIEQSVALTQPDVHPPAQGATDTAAVTGAAPATPAPKANLPTTDEIAALFRPPGKAHGGTIDAPLFSGLLRGPGTSTSDSIPTHLPNGQPGPMVSTGEFVMNGKATQNLTPALLYKLQDFAASAGGPVTADELRRLFSR